MTDALNIPVPRDCSCGHPWQLSPFIDTIDGIPRRFCLACWQKRRGE